jgi:hypothetical protein
VFLDIWKAFDTIWHLGFLYKLSELKVSVSLIKLIGYFLSMWKFVNSVEGEISTPRAPQGCHEVPSCLSHCAVYINDTPQTPGVCLGLFADDIYIYATDRKGVIFSESCSEFSVILKRGVSTGTWKSVKIRLRPSTFLIDLGPLRLILHWMDVIFPSPVMHYIWV